MEKNREWRIIPMQTQWTDIRYVYPGYTMWKGQSLQQMVLGKMDIHMEKNWTEYLCHIQLYSTQNGYLSIKPKIVKVLEENFSSMKNHGG
jgi:hypothetical protein